MHAVHGPRRRKQRAAAQAAVGVAVCLALGSLQMLGASRAAAPPQGVVLPNLQPHLVCFYDFEHPVAGDEGRERDLGSSGTPLTLINGGAAMRVLDGAHAGSRWSLQTHQINPHATGNDDWKAGVYGAGGVATMQAFGSASGITLMGWIKPAGANPAFNSNTPDPTDRYGAFGLFGVLSGDSDGHAVRALVEMMDVSGEPRLVALGRRIDGGNSHVLAANDDWRALLPAHTWTHITATFDFDAGTMALYRNGQPIAATYASTDDRWNVADAAEPDVTSPTAPAGIKIGGSFPQNTGERNAFNGRLDDLMFFNKALTADEVRRQFGQ